MFMIGKLCAIILHFPLVYSVYLSKNEQWNAKTYTANIIQDLTVGSDVECGVLCHQFCCFTMVYSPKASRCIVLTGLPQESDPQDASSEYVTYTASGLKSTCPSALAVTSVEQVVAEETTILPAEVCVHGSTTLGAPFSDSASYATYGFITKITITQNNMNVVKGMHFEFQNIPSTQIGYPEGTILECDLSDSYITNVDVSFLHTNPVNVDEGRICSFFAQTNTGPNCGMPHTCDGGSISTKSFSGDRLIYVTGRHDANYIYQLHFHFKSGCNVIT